MDIFLHILNLIEIIIFIYLGFAGIYILIFAIAGILSGNRQYPEAKDKKRFAILIPGYKEDAVIVQVAEEALKQDYPQDKYEVIIIADSFQQSTIDQLQQIPVRLIEVNFDKSTKSKSLNKAMHIIGDSYDYALILDADNIMKTDVLKRMNNAFAENYTAIQSHRIAKNTNTSYAVLDAISEEINNHLFRKGHRALGLSSALIGSGMAFDYAFFKSIMSEIEAVGGFDKELELKMLKDGYTIEYLHEAYVMDEKVQKSDVFANQRKRWLSAQFVYFGRFFKDAVQDLFLKGNLDFADKLYQMIQPPRVILLGVVFLITACKIIMSLFSHNILTFKGLPPVLWIILLSIIIIALLLSVPAGYYNKKTLKALAILPSGFITMLFSLFKLKGANKSFIHTKHGNQQNP
ncbi:MAG: glycosyltransferase family 2 protein [Bacteroidales bacterium]|nr:glycosyltransferase family 2 protein [Bacteroidales bacterium]